jgi:hypothetical protein
MLFSFFSRRVIGGEGFSDFLIERLPLLSVVREERFPVGELDPPAHRLRQPIGEGDASLGRFGALQSVVHPNAGVVDDLLATA